MAKKSELAKLKKEISKFEKDADPSTPAWARGLDMTESRRLSKTLHVSQEEIDAKNRSIENQRIAALPFCSLEKRGSGTMVRVSSVGVGYGNYNAVRRALEVRFRLGEAIPPNIYVDNATVDSVRELLRARHYRTS